MTVNLFLDPTNLKQCPIQLHNLDISFIKQAYVEDNTLTLTICKDTPHAEILSLKGFVKVVNEQSLCIYKNGKQFVWPLIAIPHLTCIKVTSTIYDEIKVGIKKRNNLYLCDSTCVRKLETLCCSSLLTYVEIKFSDLMSILVPVDENKSTTVRSDKLPDNTLFAGFYYLTTQLFRDFGEIFKFEVAIPKLKNNL